MAISLTSLAEALTAGIIQEPQLVLEIDGVSTKFGIGSIKKYIKIGDPGLLIGNDWVIGGYNDVDDQEDLISFDGTTTSISQQLLQDKGGVSSISAIQISLIDKDQIMTRLISPGEVVPDILGLRAKVWLGYRNTAFPQDFVVLFSGIIDEVDAGPTVVLNVAHPEATKRVSLFEKVTTNLTQNLHFRSAVIQSIQYTTRTDVVGTVTVQYNGGGISGSEVVTVVGTAISVLIESGVSTASKIRNALEKSIDALSLVNIAIKTGEASNTQTATGVISLLSETTINVESTAGLMLPADAGTLKTYVRINDEIIEYTGLTATTITGCTRAALESVDPRAYGRFHKSGDEVLSFYRLQGNAIDLALKLYLSGPDQYFADNVEVANFLDVPDVGSVPNAIYFEGVDIQSLFGLVAGDYVTSAGDSNAANNFTLRQIVTIERTEFGSYIVVDGAALVTSLNSAATLSFRSKYNVLPEGAGLALGGDQVDVPEFERLNELYFSAIFSYDFYLDDTVNPIKDFIDKEVMFPTGAFTIPRKGKISAGIVSPPLAVSELPYFDSSNVSKPDQNRIKRSLNRYFYNNVVFKFNRNLLDNERFLSGLITADIDSKNQITVGNKNLVIEAKGLRPGSETASSMNIISARMLERYRFAAETTQVKTFFGPSWTTDVGDVVLFGDEDLKLVDTRNATRGFKKRIFEVVNKTLDIKTGQVQFSLVDTNYLVDGRYGVFGPASFIGPGATTTSIPIKESFATKPPKVERTNWVPYVGEKILIHSDDWTFNEERTFTGFDPADQNRLLVDPPLSSAPLEDYLVDMPNYPGPSSEDGAVYKNQHPFFDPSIVVVSGASSTQFDVGVGDIAKVFVGASIILHNNDWTVVSPEVKVDSIAGVTITTSDDLGFTPTSAFIVELVGFADDEGAAYRFL